LHLPVSNSACVSAQRKLLITQHGITLNVKRQALRTSQSARSANLATGRARCPWHVRLYNRSSFPLMSIAP
jgi:hypothetical protein